MLPTPSETSSLILVTRSFISEGQSMQNLCLENWKTSSFSKIHPEFAFIITLNSETQISNIDERMVELISESYSLP